MKPIWFTLIVLLVTAAGAAAQEQRPGPVTPPPERKAKRMPETAPEPLPIPVDELIRRFTQNEDELKKLYDTSHYKLSLRVQEFEEDGSAGGEWRAVTEVVTKPDGSRVGRIAEPPQSTLKRASFSTEDVEDLASLPQFVLTTDQRDRYQITYLGKQPIDELSTYAFRIQPRRLDRRVGQFEGLVWVDDRDFAVVKTYGRMVREVEDDSTAELPFKLYETYRELVENKYWLPTYTRSEDTIKSQSGEARLRLTIRISDYRLAEKPK